jgi:hypothetical protein
MARTGFFRYRLGARYRDASLGLFWARLRHLSDWRGGGGIFRRIFRDRGFRLVSHKSSAAPFEQVAGQGGMTTVVLVVAALLFAITARWFDLSQDWNRVGQTARGSLSVLARADVSDDEKGILARRASRDLLVLSVCCAGRLALAMLPSFCLVAFAGMSGLVDVAAVLGFAFSWQGVLVACFASLFTLLPRRP